MIICAGYEPGQEEEFLTLYRACLDHYAIDPATEAQEARVIGLLNTRQHMSCLMAWSGGAPVGFATWALTFPAGASLALYMKELFVLSSARGLGVGRALLSGLVEIAEAEGCARMDWQTDQDNQISQRFYARINAPAFDKRTYRVMSADFAAFRANLA